MVSITADPAMALTISGGSGTGTFQYGRDLVAWTTRVVDTIGAVDRLSADIEPLGERVDHQAMLAARTEPAIAEFATLRHEVLYLREAIERLRADLDSEVSSPDQR